MRHQEGPNGFTLISEDQEDSDFLRKINNMHRPGEKKTFTIGSKGGINGNLTTLSFDKTPAKK